MPSTSTANIRTRKHTRQPSEVASTEPVFYGEAFTGNPVIDPVDYFNDQLDDDMKASFIIQSNLFSVQKDPIKPLDIKVPELEQLIGMLFYMSIVRMPRADMYWSVEMRYPKVADAMPIVCFKTIKRMFHVSDNESRPADCQDRLYKIRPLVDAVQEKVRGIIPD